MRALSGLDVAAEIDVMGVHGNAPDFVVRCSEWVERRMVVWYPLPPRLFDLNSREVTG